MPQWPGDAAPSTGNVGGGTWLLSAHSANLKAATDFLTWVTTVERLPGQAGARLPGLRSGGQDLAGGAGRLRLLRRRHQRRSRPPPTRSGPAGATGQFSQEAIWAATVTPGLTPGKSDRLAAAGLADRDRQLRQGRRIPGLAVTRAPTRGRPATAARAARAARPEPGRARLRRRLRGPAGRLRRRAHRLRDLLRVHRRRRHASPAVATSPPPAQDFRFLPAVGHVALYLVFWLLSLVVFVVGAVAAAAPARRAAGVSKALRFLYYIPGALAGAASVMVWLFMLDPTVSPVSFLLRRARATTPSARSSPPATCRSCSRSSRSGPARAAGSW